MQLYYLFNYVIIYANSEHMIIMLSENVNQLAFPTKTYMWLHFSCIRLVH